ncbi:hypothetical protein BH23BAC1_BH23BAC1_26790 [soil metagenome]
MAGSANVPDPDGHPFAENAIFSLFKLNADGDLDAEFGEDGRLLFFIDDSSIQEVHVNDAALQSGDRIIIAGTAVSDYYEINYNVIARINPDGTIDEEFNEGNFKITGGGAISQTDFGIQRIAIQEDDNIILGGTYGIRFFEYHSQLIRLMPDGGLDPSFGDEGLVLELPEEGVSDIAIQPDQKILVAFGDTLARYHPDGSFDENFGENNYLRAHATLLEVQPDNKFLTANPRGYVSRYLEDAEGLHYEGRVTRLMLINAETNEELFELENDIEIDLLELSINAINIRAYTDPEITGSVKFDLSGAETYSHIENIEPYALFLNEGLNFFSWLPEGGKYFLTATPYSSSKASGEAGSPLRISFTIKKNIPRVERLTLINAENNEEVMEIHDHSYIYLNEIGTSFINIRAYTNPIITGSVSFHLSSLSNPDFAEYQHIENIEPYALFQNLGDDYFGWNAEEGVYRLMVTPYTEAYGRGMEGSPLSVIFEIRDIVGTVELVKIAVIDAETNEELFDLESESILNLKELGTREINFRAYTNPTIVGSVYFNLIGPENHYNIEHVEPYALFGNNGNNFFWLGPIPGEYFLLVVPHHHPIIREFDPVVRYSFAFTIIDESTNDRNSFQAYPNPGSDKLNIPVNETGSKNLQIQVFDFSGNEVLSHKNISGYADVISLDVSHLRSNPYLIRIISETEVKQFKWFKE